MTAPNSDNEATQRLEPIRLNSVVISPSGHVMITLDTSRRVNGAGRDLVVWGRNVDGELGNGKRSSVAAPATVEDGDGGRVQLGARRAEARDARGRVWNQGVALEQRPTAGHGTSAIYWRILPL